MNSVKVLCRIRPINDIECVSLYNSSCLLLGNRPFTFDYVYKSDSKTSIIFNDACIPLLEKFMQGFNCTILAYGQTYSGKTHTMGTDVNYKDGIIPNALKELFQRIKDSNISDATVTVSFLEIYNEELIDLLMLENQPKIREAENQIYWSNVHQQPCQSYSEALDYLYKGSSNRKTGSTEMNATSSRSHAIFAVEYKTGAICSRFCFVDLAGSERLKRTNASGMRQKEGISINSGLLALGNVIYALSKNQHVPYRDSKLTRILQDSLGGNAHTTMIACISPRDSDFQETLNTLKYASRAREIQNQAIRNLIDSDDDVVKLKEIIRQLRTENEELRQSKHYNPQIDALTKENKALTLELEFQKSKYVDLNAEFQLKSMGDVADSAVTPNKNHYQIYSNIIEQLRKRLRRFQRLVKPHVPAQQSWYQTDDVESEWEDVEELKAEESSDSNDSSTSDDQQEINNTIISIQNNIQSKEDILRKMELSQVDYEQLKLKYESKMDELELKCKEISKERDAFLRKSTDSNSSQIKEIRNKYEDKLTKIQSELAVLRSKHHSTEKTLAKIRDKAKIDADHMRANIAELRNEKSRLMMQLKTQNEKSRRITVKNEREVMRLKKKELKSEYLLKKYERHIEMQKSLLRVRSNESVSMKRKWKDAVHVMKKHGISANSLAAKRRDSCTDMNELKSTIDKFVDLCSTGRQATVQLQSLISTQRDMVEEKLRLLDEKEIIIKANETISIPISTQYLDDRFNEIQSDIVVVNERIKEISFAATEASDTEILNALQELQKHEAVKLLIQYLDDFIDMKVLYEAKISELKQVENERKILRLSVQTYRDIQQPDDLGDFDEHLPQMEEDEKQYLKHTLSTQNKVKHLSTLEAQ